MWALLAPVHAAIKLHRVVIGPWPTMITTARVHLATVMEAWDCDLENVIQAEIGLTHLPRSLT